MAVRIQFRRDTSVNWILHNPVLLDGEIGIETNTREFKIGNGSDDWITLPYGGFVGAKGDIGETGPAGLTGAQGNIGPEGPAGKDAVINYGSAVVDFGSAPGTNVATATVSGQSNILNTSIIKVFITGDSTTVSGSAGHNSFEHMYLSSKLSLAGHSITPGVGFTITAMTDLRISSTLKVHWEWY